MSNILYEKKFKESGKLEFTRIEDRLKIKVGDEFVTIDAHHEQDCCEHVYADWATLDYYAKQLEDKYSGFQIKGLPYDGFMLIFKESWGRDEKVFIPCYNEQNGYYSKNLHLIIKDGEDEKNIDISEYVTDNEY